MPKTFQSYPMTSTTNSPNTSIQENSLYRRLFIRNLKVNVRIGVHDFELLEAQPMLFNADIYALKSMTTSTRDNIEDVLDYDFMRQTILTLCSGKHISLQETLCDDIAKALLTHQNVHHVRVSTQKVNVYPDCDGVGVEVFVSKEGL
jgi:7,8-dihydroneopterin aldolase/epimerase/oxygenase